MDDKEYMNTLMEQIGDKRARELVYSEIQSHIEELTASYIEDGMNPDDAAHEAVRQMGDPVQVGIKLNKIHRPKFPYSFLACAVLLIAVGIITQIKIFPLLQNESIDLSYFSRTIGYNIFGLCISLGIIYFDYTILAKYSSRLWFIFPISAFLLFLFNVEGAVPILRFLLSIFPIIFASFIYSQRNRKMKGIFLSYAMQFFVILCLARFSIFSGFTLETFLICFLILETAIWKGIFGKVNRIKYALFTCSLPFIHWILTFISLLPLKDYQKSRISSFFSTELRITYNHVFSELKNSVESYSLWGNHELSMTPFHELVSDYMVNNIFSWFGIAVGALIITLLAIFCIKSLSISLKQSNRIGFLLGTGCSITLLVRTILYICSNFGVIPGYSTYIPFLQYGFIHAVLNSIYVGIIMCVYRNSNILNEKREYESKGITKKGNTFAEN